MKKTEIKTPSGKCKITIGDSIKNIKKYIPSGNVCIITDKTVYSIYSNLFPKAPVIELEPGEKSKSIETVMEVYKAFMDNQVDRSWFILGIGGGTICDITGFASTTYLRGLSFGLIPTTLLSQVDAAIGGKNGVNFAGYKNIIGTVRQPDFVFCDTGFLKTLKPADIDSGFAEIIKYSFIADKKLYNLLDSETKKSILSKKDLIEKLIDISIEIKKRYVEKDEKDTGVRNELNFGHTIGHAIEKIRKCSHGSAISIGMSLALEFSVNKSYLNKNEKNRGIYILQKYELPVLSSENAEEIIDAVKKDKKRNSEQINFVFLEEIGKAKTDLIEYNELENFLKGL